MLANWRAIWDLGEVAYRYPVLLFVGKHDLPESWALYWEALEVPDHEDLLRGLAIGFLLLPSFKRDLTPEQLTSLVDLVRAQAHHTTRLFALMLLEQKSHPEYEAILRELATERSPEVAFEANLKLQERGFDRAGSLLDNIVYFEYPRDGLDRVWGLRQKLHLNEQQHVRLLTLMTRHVRRVRHKFWRLPDLPSAIELQEYLARGVAIEDGDIEEIGRAVFRYREERSRTTGYRIRIVEAVAWFANDRARDWLRAIRDAEILPKTVRAAAGRELRKLDAARVVQRE